MTFKAFVLLLATAAPALAIECDATKLPNWDSCDGLLNRINSEGEQKYNSCDTECRTWRDDSQNCRIAWCFDEGLDGCQTISTGEFHLMFDPIKDWCSLQNSGGKYDSPSGYLTVYQNPDYVPPPSNSGKKLKIRGRDVGPSKRNPSVQSTAISHEKWEDILEEERKASSADPESNNLAKVEKREDDTPKKWTTYISYKGIPRPGDRIQVSSQLSSGVTETWTSTESESVSFESSISVGASAFDIFSVETSVSFGYEESYSIAEGQSFTSGDCPKFGIVYWEPVYDKYNGYFDTDSTNYIDIWIPRERDGKAEGRFVTECLG